MNSSVKNVSIIGTGTMGNGIAHTFALKGFKVSLVGINSELCKKAITTISGNLDRQVNKAIISPEEKEKALRNLSSFTTVSEGVKEADLVVEAVFEDIETKKNLFKQLDESAPSHTILASNTSSISITKLASFTKRPEKVAGMHFMNPVPVMKLVEVINGYDTSPETRMIIFSTAEALGKMPIEANDYPGFIANRILMPMINEAIYSLFEGVGGVREIDSVMKLGMAHPMGPLQLADFIGLDVCLAILNVMYFEFKNQKYAPCPLLVKMVESGNLGVKSGNGFYKYSPGSKDLEVADKFSKP